MNTKSIILVSALALVIPAGDLAFSVASSSSIGGVDNKNANDPKKDRKKRRDPNQPPQVMPGPPVPIITDCRLERSTEGWKLIVNGHMFKKPVTVTVGGITPREVNHKEPSEEPDTYKRLVLKGRICRGLPGDIVVTNPGGGRSPAPYQCALSCEE
jgi:hypothetical protein